MLPATRCVVAVLLSLLASAAWATYARVDIVDVPIDRLVANLQRRVAASPKTAHLHYALARVHAIAWAQRTLTIRMEKPYGKPPDETSIGNDSSPPGPSPKGKPPISESAARKHLAAAQKEYLAAVQLDSTNLPSRLGYGWALLEGGQKVAARAPLRIVFEQAQKSGDRYLTREAGGYLLIALDGGGDTADVRAKVDAVKAEIAEWEKRPRPVTPIVVPLTDEVALEALVDPLAAVPFDLDASGIVRPWQWITPRAGWLVFGDAPITSGTHLVGDRTFWIFWQDGYDALSSLDDDGDGWVSGDELRGLSIWCDADQDGVCGKGEVKPLSAYGMTALSCASTPHPGGFPYSPAGVRMTDGTTRPTYDWIARATVSRGRP